MNPSLATGSVSYSMVNDESDVASVLRTWTALDKRWLKGGHPSSISRGVNDIRSSSGGGSSSHGVLGVGGDGGAEAGRQV